MCERMPQRMTELEARFVVPAPDARLEAAAQVLCAEGCVRLPPEQAGEAAFVLLGVPVASLLPWRQLLAQVRPGTTLFIGAPSEEARRQAAELALPMVDYMESEELALFNAVPTAEGALAILLTATPETLWRSKVLLTGFGRISRVLAPRLQALGARVTVVARSAAARLQAEIAGYTAVGFDALLPCASRTDILINTVPFPVADETVLAALPQGAFVLELAGAPGGVDRAAAQRLAVQLRLAPGLPGKVAPAAAGRAIGRTILRFWHGNDRPAAQIQGV